VPNCCMYADMAFSQARRAALAWSGLSGRRLGRGGGDEAGALLSGSRVDGGAVAGAACAGAGAGTRCIGRGAAEATEPAHAEDAMARRPARRVVADDEGRLRARKTGGKIYINVDLSRSCAIFTGALTPQRRATKRIHI
jgi:hypothetical protein